MTTEFSMTPEFDPLNDISLDDIDFDFNVNEETGEVNYEKPTEDAEQVDEEDYTGYGDEPTVVDAHSFIADLQDTDELNIGDRKISKGKLVELATKADEVEAEHSYVQALASNLKHSEKHLAFIKSRSLSEVDHQIAAIDNILRDPQLSDSERGARVRQRQGLETRQHELNNEFQRGESLIEAQKAEMLGVRIKQTDEAMVRKYGAEWNKDAQDVYNFAIGIGVAPDALREALSPAMADILVMARKYAIAEHKSKQKRSEAIASTIARSKQPRKTNSPVGQPTRKPTSSVGKNTRDALVDEWDNIAW